MDNVLSTLCTVAVIGVLLVGGNINNMYPAGIRLNNPGNIRKSHDIWEGATKLQDEGAYIRFRTPECGIRALVKLIHNYHDKYRVQTIYGIISRYAPPSENDTTSYISDVAKRTKFHPHEEIDLDDIGTLILIAKAIVIHENGMAPDNLPYGWYEEVTYHRAAMSALYEEERCYGVFD